MWTYRCYDDGGTPNLWQRWYDLNPKYRGTHDAVFGMIEQMPVWQGGFVDYLDKPNKIVEVRLRGDVMYRILGVYRPGREFIVLGTCSHKGKVYDPKDIKKTVVKRKKEVEADIERTIACGRPIDPS